MAIPFPEGGLGNTLKRKELNRPADVYKETTCTLKASSRPLHCGTPPTANGMMHCRPVLLLLVVAVSAAGAKVYGNVDKVACNEAKIIQTLVGIAAWRCVEDGADVARDKAAVNRLLVNVAEGEAGVAAARGIVDLLDETGKLLQSCVLPSNVNMTRLLIHTMCTQ